MKKKLIYLPMAAMLLLAACGGDKQEETPAKQEKETPKAEVCNYVYDETSTSISWTAYKHTERNEVNGKVDDFEITGINPGENIIDIMKGVEFTIHTASVNSGDSARDAKISNIFFGTMVNSADISGKIESANEDGTAEVSLSINDITGSASATYTFDEGAFKLIATVDFSSFGGDEAIAALNEACKAKHTGEDGVLIMHPDVKIVVVASFTKECE